MDELELSIVMPCLNEAETLATCLLKAQRFLQEHGIAGEIIVADNGSTDGSIEIATRHGARVVVVQERGYGSALLGGIAATQGRAIIMGDADDSYDFTALLPFVEKLREGFDLVMGNRFLGGIALGAMPWLHRALGNPVLSGLGRLFFRSGVGDFHCGLRGFQKASVVRMDLQTTGMEFASEMIVKASLLGMRIAEVPTRLSPAGRTRRPHLRTWRDGWRHLRFMLLYSPRWLFLYPGLLLMILGAATGIWLLPGPRRIGAITVDVHTLLYAAAAVFMGFQTVLFAVFTKVFGVSAGLLPPDLRFRRWFEYIRLETGLAAGGILLAGGIAASVYAVRAWGDAAFGPLDASRTLRLVIPAVLMLVLGSQVILASFFLSVLGLRRHGQRLV